MYDAAQHQPLGPFSPASDNGFVISGNISIIASAQIGSNSWTNLYVGDVLYISQDTWLNGVNIQTAGTIGLGFTSYFF